MNNDYAINASSESAAHNTVDRRVRRGTRLRESIRAIVKGTIAPGRLWYYSTLAFQARLYPLAWFIKALSFFLFKSLLSVQSKVAADVELKHLGIGCVIHPNVTIGRGVKIHQYVTIAGETWIGSPSRIVIEDDVVIGTHALIIGNNHGGLRIGAGAVIGAGAIVSRDVPAKVVVLPMPSRAVKMVKTEFD